MFRLIARQVLNHFRTSIPDIEPHEICMIGMKRTLLRIVVFLFSIVGDRLLTDVVFANQNKMHSVLVKPLSNTKDHPVAVVLRLVNSDLTCTFDSALELWSFNCYCPF